MTDRLPRATEAEPASDTRSSAGTVADDRRTTQLKQSLRGQSYAVQRKALSSPAGYLEQAARLAPVQHSGAGGATDVHAEARKGTATASTQLPYSEQIQASFGRHDISSVQAHSGGAAAASAEAMGAAAYATSNHVVLGRGTDLHTVAHEAAHVVQQRAGVSLSGGVGAVGDGYEQHADAVADAVVGGRSAEGLLDGMAGGGKGPPGKGSSGDVQLLSTKAQWVTASAVPACIGSKPRTAKMTAIGTALEVYEGAGTVTEKVSALGGVLGAIAGWQLLKDEKAGQDVSTGINDLDKAVPKVGAHDQSMRSDFVNALLIEVRDELVGLLAAKQAAWDPGNLSDVSHHDPTNFTYLINGIQEYTETPAHIQSVLNDPSNIENALISASLVSNTKTPMWCGSGYVLKAPKGNIASSKGSDQGARSAVSLFHEVEMYKEVARLFALNGMPTPAEVLAATTQTQYQSKHNEIVIQGTGADGAKTEVVAIFVATAPGTSDPTHPIEIGEKVQEVKIKVDGVYKGVVNRKPATSAERYAEYVKIAAAKGIPIVAIPMAANAGFSNPKLTIWNPATMILEADARERGLIE